MNEHSDTSDDSIPAADQHRLAVQQAVVRHQNVLLAYVLSIEPSLANDQAVVQEVFLVISRNAETWTAGTNFLAWACTIARYETLQLQRKQGREKRLLDADVVELLHTEIPSDAMDIQADIESLKRCLDQLAPRARQLVDLRYHSGLMPETIASQVGWSVNSVRVALTRARDRLRDCLKRELVPTEVTL